MSCTVYSTRLLGELVQQSQSLTESSGLGSTDMPKQKTGKAKAGGRNSNASVRLAKQQLAKRVMRNKAYWSEQDKMQIESERKVKKKLERKTLEKEIYFNNLCKSLDIGRDVQAEIQETLDLQEKRQRRKQEARFAEWTEKVYKPIQDRIQGELDKRNFSDTMQMRRDEYEKFLNTTNQKKSLFLDIIIESDYNPFVPNQKSIKFKTGKLNDPLKRVLTKDQEEKDMMPVAQDANPMRQYSRGTLDVTMWGSGKVESTPHGHFAKMMDDKNQNQSTKVNLYKTNFCMDHFNVPTGKAVVDSEFPKGKRVNFGQYDKPNPLVAE